MRGFGPNVTTSRGDSRRARLALLLGALALAPALAAQTVSPPIAEYQERARSSFQLVNGSIFPLSVVLELKGLDVSEQGEVIDGPFDSSRVSVKLSATSFRIPPRSTYTVFYQATADSTPAWFQIIAALSGARTDEGLNLRIMLPHVVYLNQREPLRKDDVRIRQVRLDPGAKKARIELENAGPRLGRVQELVLSSPGAEGRTGGFPLLPRRRRWAEVDWAPAVPPTRLVARFAKFTLDTAVAVTPPAQQMADSARGTDAPPTPAGAAAAR
ncbi:MAG TPA: hypothetical protein VFU46_05895 [Gemmatimonadales bacterium]|nr:hypothetical protein [Gemmatimonadales bacterium]